MSDTFNLQRFYSELKSALPASTGEQRKSFVNTIIEHEVPLLELSSLLSCDEKIATRFLWLISEIGILHREKLHAELPRLLEFIQKEHPEYLNSFASWWHYVGVPEENEAQAIDLLFKWLMSSEINVSIKTRALWALVELSKKYPDLKQELKLSLNDQANKYSPDFQKRARKILTELE